MAINSALEVDLTGQVCAGLAGLQLLQRDRRTGRFHRGAARSKGGKAIIASAVHGKECEPDPYRSSSEGWGGGRNVTG